METTAEFQCHPMNTVRWHLGRKTLLKSHTTHPFDLGHEQVITFLYKKAKEEYSSLGAPSTLTIFSPYIVLTNLCFLWEEKKREPVSAQEKSRHM